MLQDQLKLLSYIPEVTSWLESCRAKCRSSRVAIFLDEFLRAIQKEIEGVAEMNDREHLVAQIISRADVVSAAMEVIAARDKIRSALLGKFESQIDELKEANWLLSSDLSGKPLCGFSLDFEPASPVIFRIEFYRAGFRDASYGLFGRGEKSSPYIRQALLDKLGRDEGGKPDDLWAWWRHGSLNDEFVPMEKDWESGVKSWASIMDGSLARSMVATTKLVRDVLAGAQRANLQRC